MALNAASQHTCFLGPYGENDTLLEKLVARMLRTTPAHRFQSAREVIDAIDARRTPADWLTWRRRGVQAVLLTLLISVAPSVWRRFVR